MVDEGEHYKDKDNDYVTLSEVRSMYAKVMQRMDAIDKQLIKQKMYNPIDNKILEKKAIELKKDYIDYNNHIDVKKLRVAMRDNGVSIGHNKAYELKTILELHHRELFGEV